MIQYIAIICYDLFDWVNDVIEWKKKKLNEVSDYFDLTRGMCFAMLDEVERLASDLFLKDLLASKANIEHGRHLTKSERMLCQAQECDFFFQINPHKHWMSI